MRHLTARMLLVLAIPANAFAGGTAYQTTDASGLISFSDRGAPASAQALLADDITRAGLIGQWQATESDGRTTDLTLRGGGGFVLDRRAADSPERLYLCGAWHHAEESVGLSVNARREQLASGEIVDTPSPDPTAFTVLRSTFDVLIVRMNDSVLTFHRQQGKT